MFLCLLARRDRFELKVMDFSLEMVDFSLKIKSQKTLLFL